MSLTRIGRYEVEKELGRGAMAVVYKAVDPLIGRTVAVKTIRLDSSMGEDPEFLRQRLYREAQSAGNLNHPNIVTIYDIGEESGFTYIAMEFIEGESLEDWIQRNHIPPVDQTVSIVEQIASGLDYAAQRGITHRDIKPANILITSDLRPKIADFGIARFSTAKLTQTGVVMGTPAYMSPEQAMGRTIDGRSDIFSLGVMFYEMLTGERPFAGNNPTTIIYKIVHEEPVPPRSLNISLSASLDTIVRRMLAKDPAQRYQSGAELVNDLRNQAGVKTLAPGTAVTAAQPAAAPSRTKPLLMATVLLLVAAVGALAWVLYQQYTGKNAKPEVPAVSDPVPAPQAQAKPPVAAPAPAPVETAAEPKAAAEKKAVEKPAFAQLTFTYKGESYPLSVFDDNRSLGAAGPSSSLRISAGERRLRIVSEGVYLDWRQRVRLKPDEVVELAMPGLASAYVEVPAGAFDGCEIQVGGQALPKPYPAQVRKIAAGQHEIAFRWSSGPFLGRDFTGVIALEAGHHYLVNGDPRSGQVTVQMVR